MKRRAACLSLIALAAVVMPGQPRAEGDAARGAQNYRACTACHSLEPAMHLTGPSLAGLWGARSASVDGFHRYSQAFTSLDFVWDENSLNAWLSDPQAMAPGTYMNFRGVEDETEREDLIAFLAIVLQPGGAETAIEMGIISEDAAKGQVPQSLGDVGPEQRVASIRHCEDAYFVATADGVETAYWELNVRLKIDSSERGPHGQPVLVYSGMVGDRISIVFSDIGDLTRSIKVQC